MLINPPHASQRMRNLRGFFLLFFMKYAKIPKTAEQHCLILSQRGLLVSDKKRAIRYLKNIGYYRLTGYMFHLQSNDGKHQFISEVQFEEIIQLYKFDKKLRSVILYYLEEIEICLRARLTDRFSLSNGFYWYNNIELFNNVHVFNTINQDIAYSYKNPKEMFLKKFREKYIYEELPPSNMALEILSLGKLARLYKALKNQGGKLDIADEFELPSNILSSWLIYLANVRNICAHHARLWNKRVTVDRPIFPNREKYKFIGENYIDSNTTLYGIISMIHRLLMPINQENNFVKKIETIINEFDIDTSLMGFPLNWRETANWKKM